MNCLWAWILVGASATLLGQQPIPRTMQETDVMLVGISRDDSMFKGGISSSKWTGKGTVVSEPIARIAASGNWLRLPCDSESTAECTKFAHDYLSKPHVYTVISADGQGGQIKTAPVSLSECFGYDGVGTYAGTMIAGSSIAASSTEFFADSLPPQPLGEDASAPIRKALTALIPSKLDSVKRLRLFSLDLQGQKLVVVQRVFADYASNRKDEKLGLIFAIGSMDHNHFKILHWKKNTEDEQERILGTIHLNSGQEFLVTVVSDPESQSFRVYGIEDGRLKMIFSGGGSSC